MKKLIFLIPMLFLIILIDTKEQAVLIPEESIRFRVIANSDNSKDQELKSFVKEDLQKILTKMPNNNIEESYKYLKNNLVTIDDTIQNTLIKANSNTTYQISLGYNYFPEKKYKGAIYPEGNYRSLVVKLGKGKGKNWWCVLYPPLCDIELEEQEEVEYKFYLQEILNKF